MESRLRVQGHVQLKMRNEWPAHIAADIVEVCTQNFIIYMYMIHLFIIFASILRRLCLCGVHGIEFRCHLALEMAACAWHADALEHVINTFYSLLTKCE